MLEKEKSKWKVNYANFTLQFLPFLLSFGGSLPPPHHHHVLLQNVPSWLLSYSNNIKQKIKTTHGGIKSKNLECKKAEIFSSRNEWNHIKKELRDPFLERKKKTDSSMGLLAVKPEGEEAVVAGLLL